ncbi:MAG: hypothetical protein ACLQVL_32215 [Terriglobia bacterium]
MFRSAEVQFGTGGMAVLSMNVGGGTPVPRRSNSHAIAAYSAKKSYRFSSITVQLLHFVVEGDALPDILPSPPVFSYT